MTVVRIDRIAAGGDGVGRLDDGLTVFVPRTAVGDEAEVEITARKRRYARARLVAIETPSPDRVETPCPHYAQDGCGGCQLQHLSLDAQHRAKRRIVGDALRRIAKRDLEDPEIIPSPEPWRYRAKITLAISDDGERIGLHPHDRPGVVFPLRDCHITREPLMALWGRVRRGATQLPRGANTVVLREDTEGGTHVIVRGGSPPWDPAGFVHDAALTDASVWWQPERGAERVVAGPATGFPALAFEQVNPAFADRIRGEAIATLGDVSGKTVWDLYGGAGEGARALAARGAVVWSVDADRSAVQWAERRPVPPEAPTGSPRYLVGRVEDVLHRLPQPDLVTLNPPRGGCHARVAAALNGHASRVSRVAYVSCDPATLARDLGRMPAYSVRSVTAYDLFPQTSHVETVTMLEAA